MGKISRKLFLLLVCDSEKVKVKDSHAGIDDRGRDSHLFYSTMTKIQALESSGKDIAWWGKEKIINKKEGGREGGRGTKISVTSH